MAANYNHDRGRLIYELVVRQEPKQARMCGVGGKADRRPIDPPPIVQLRVIDPALQSGDSSASGTSKTRRDSIADSASSSSPGPRPYDDVNGDTSNYAQSFLQNPYYFMFASLARPDDETELHWLKDGRTRCTTGSVVSSLYHLKDPHNNNEDAGFFVFPDLSVRTEGSYRLKLSLFEVVGNNVHHCKSIYSAPFYVYTAKKFPGMEESTPLSCSLADQGIKIRIRKDIRVRKRPIPALSQPLPMTVDGEESDGDDDEEDSDLGSGRQQKRRRESKRSRLDDPADASGSSMNQQQLPWPPAASINPSLGPTIPPPPAAPPNALPSSSVVIPPPPKPGKETPPANGIAMGVHVPPGSTLPGPSVFDGRGGGIISFEQPAVESATQSPAAAHTTSPPTAQYRDPNLSDEPTSPQTMTTPPQMSPPAQHIQQTQQQQYAAPAATTGVAPMPPQQQFQPHQQSAAVTSPAALPPQPITHAPPTHLPPPSVQHQPQHPQQQHMQHPQQPTSYPPAPYPQWSAAPMPAAQPSVYDPYYHHPQQHPHYTNYAPPPPQQAMPPPPARYDYPMYGHTQPSISGYGYYDQHQQHHPHPQAQMMQPPPHPYTQHQMHPPPPVPHQFAQPPSAPPSNAPTSSGGTTHVASEAQQTNGINGAGSPGSMPPPSYSASATPVSATTASVAAAPNGGGYDYATTPMYNNRPHTEAATVRAGYAPTSTPAPAPYGMHPTVAHTQPAPPPPHPHPQLYPMHAAAVAAPPHPSHVAQMRPYAPPPPPHAPPPHPSYSYTPYSAPPPPAPEWNTQPFVNTVATHQHGWDAYGHHAHQSQPQNHGGVGQSAPTHTQTSPVAGAVNNQGHRIQLAPLIPGASATENGTHSGTGAPSTHGSNASGSSPTMHSPTRTIHSASSSPTTLRTSGGGGRVSMSSSGRDHRGGGEEGGHGYQNHGHVQGKKNPLSIGSIISEDVR